MTTTNDAVRRAGLARKVGIPAAPVRLPPVHLCASCGRPISARDLAEYRFDCADRFAVPRICYGCAEREEREERGLPPVASTTKGTDR